MKGIPSFSGKIVFLRALLLIFVLMLSVSLVNAKTVVLGTGSGRISVQNMTGLSPGDTLAISPGAYLGASFSNLQGIVITNNNGAVVFNGTVNLNTLVSCTFAGFQFINVPGMAILWGGNSRRCVERNISFSNVQGDANNASDHNAYTGDTSSLKLYLCTFDSLTLYRTGLVMMGSWGDAASGICFMDSIIFSRIKVDSTNSNGTEVRGTFFRMDAHDWRVIYKGTNTVLGDVGIFYITGSGYIHNIYRNGGRGYIARVFSSGLKGQRPGDCYFYNNIDLNSTVYGSIDARSETHEAALYTNGGNCFVYNNTAGNKADNIGYWSSLAVAGTFVAPYRCEVKNNLGFNINAQAHNPIAMNQGSGSVPDTANNLYFAKPDGVVDPVSGIPVANSPVLGKGLFVNWINDDFYHNPRTGAYDIGAVQHGGTAIPPANLPPVVIVGPLQSINLPASNAKLDGSKSYDPDNQISTYLWELVAGAGVAISAPNAVTTQVTGLTLGTYVFKLTVTDESNASSFALDTIIVKAAQNQPPLANAGANQTISLPATTVTIDGSSSRDQDGFIVGYSWKQTSGPTQVIIDSPLNASSLVSGLQKGTYVFYLKVTDNNAAAASDSVIINVQVAGNKPPIADAGTGHSITLPADSVALDGTGSSDPDGTISTYSWIQVAGPAVSTINAATAATATATNLTAGQYIFQVTVTDNSGATDAAQVKITVIASGVQPPVANAGANQTITLPTNRVTLNGSASAASSGIARYEWKESSGPSQALLRDTSIEVVDSLQAGTYIFYLTITDSTGASASDSVIIKVNPAANTAPVANAGPGISLMLPEDSATLNGSASHDPDGSIGSYSWAKISGPGTPAANGAGTDILKLTGLVAGQYIYELTVTDNRGATASAQVKISVADAPNLAPVADAGTDKTITAPASTVNLDGSGSYDPDGSITSYSWAKLSGPATFCFSHSYSGAPSVIGLQPGVYVFELTVTDNRGATGKNQVTITVNPKIEETNLPPVAHAGNNLTITAPNDSVALSGTGSADPDGTITSYSWKQVSGTTAASISGANSATPAVSKLEVGQYIFELTVTDNDGATGSDQVIITVNPGDSTVHEPAPADQLIVYPNPAHDLVNGKIISFNKGTTQIRIYDMNGRPVLISQVEKTENTVIKTFDISRLAGGMYVMQVSIANKETMVSKFIKN